jgi:putative zinc ribbon protein
MLSDKTLTCVDCGSNFTFTTGDWSKTFTSSLPCQKGLLLVWRRVGGGQPNRSVFRVGNGSYFWLASTGTG